MIKATLQFMAAITAGSLFVVIGHAAHAQARFADYQTRAPIVRGCQQLAQMAADGWADVERGENISCLESGDITRVSYDRMLDGFTEDCTNAVIDKLGADINVYGDHDVALSRRELTYMFVQRYDPVFREFCSAKYEGQAVTSR